MTVVQVMSAAAVVPALVGVVVEAVLAAEVPQPPAPEGLSTRLLSKREQLQEMPPLKEGRAVSSTTILGANRTSLCRLQIHTLFACHNVW